jgi:hypothetical protein
MRFDAEHLAGLRIDNHSPEPAPTFLAPLVQPINRFEQHAAHHGALRLRQRQRDLLGE